MVNPTQSSELVEMQQKLERHNAQKEDQLRPSGFQGPQKGYLDISALLSGGTDPTSRAQSYGMRKSVGNNDDYLVGGSTQLQAALNLTTGMYMANDRVTSTPTPLFSSSSSVYSACSSGYNC